MQITRYNAFGYKIAKTEIEKDEIVTDENHPHYENTILISKLYNPDILKKNITPKTVNNIWLVTEGLIEYVNLYTGTTLDWSEGYCTLDTPMPVGFWSSTHLSDSIVWCFNAFDNQDVVPVMPDVSTFRLEAGSSTTTSGQQRIFLCSGEMSINGTAVTGSKQLIISSGKTIAATTNCYGFKFN